MLTAGIATSDPASSGQLRAALQQTGLVSSVREWSIVGSKPADSLEAAPDVVLLDISRDAEAFFAQAAQLRRLRPTVRVIACCPVAQPGPEFLLEAMRSGVQEILPKPVSASALHAILSAILQESQVTEKRSVEKTIVVMGSKGGVGATTVAVNLGVQMALLSRRRVGLLDFARPLGNAHLMLDLHPRFTVRDAVENLERLDSHFFSSLMMRHPTQLHVLAGTSQPEEWDRMTVSAVERVINVAQGALDFVLVDFGSQFSPEWSSVLARARTILLVAEASVPSLWALERRALALAGFGVDAERVRIVINRWRRGDDEALRTVEKNVKRPVFACLPNDFRQVCDAINTGAPLISNHNNPLVGRYRALAAQLAGIDVGRSEKRSGLSNLFSFGPKR